MTFSDASSVFQIEQQCFAIPWSLESIRKDLGTNPLAHYLGGYEKGRLIGYAGMWQVMEEVHITNIAVLPAFRRRGAGQALLEALLRHGTALGAQSATLEVRPSNQEALALYQKNGFVIRGRRKKYYTDNGEDALILWNYFEESKKPL